MPIMFTNGVVHAIRKGETRFDFGHLLCGEMYSNDSVYSDFVHRHGKVVHRPITCLYCLTCRKGP